MRFALRIIVVTLALCWHLQASADSTKVSKQLSRMFSSAVDSVCMNYAYFEVDRANQWVDAVRMSTYDSTTFVIYRCLELDKKVTQGLSGEWTDSLKIFKEYFDRRVEEGGDTAAIYGQIVANMSLGINALRLNSDSANVYFEAAVNRALEVNNMRMASYCTLLLTESLMAESRFVDTNDYARRVLNYSNISNDPRLRFHVLIQLIRSYTRLNITNLIDEYDAMVLDDGWYTTTPLTEATYLRCKLNYLVQNKDFSNALLLVDRLKLATDLSGNLVCDWHTALSLMKLSVELEKWDEAEEQMAVCHQSFENVMNTLFDRGDARQVLCLYEAIIAVGRGDYARAERIMDEADFTPEFTKSQAYAKLYHDTCCRISSHKGDYRRATEMLLQENRVLDSILASNIAQRSLDLQISYQNDTTIQQQRYDLYQKKHDMERMHVMSTMWFLVALIVTLGISLGYVISVRQKRKLSEAIERERRQQLEKEVKRQTLALKKQNEQLSMRNLDMLRSQTYAKHIQDSVLPSEESLATNEYTANSYIIFKAQNVTSGDFYWFKQTHSGQIVVCCADSWGSGVPGTMMSMMGITIISSITGDEHIDSASEVLEKFSSTLGRILPTVNAHDGINCSLAVISPDEGKICLSIAHQRVIFSHDGELKMYSGVRRRLGDNAEPFASMAFEDVVLDYAKGDSLYLFTDGVTNLFNSQTGAKLKTSGLQRLIVEVEKEPTEKREVVMRRLFSAWIKDSTLNDDLTLIALSL